MHAFHDIYIYIYTSICVYYIYMNDIYIFFYKRAVFPALHPHYTEKLALIQGPGHTLEGDSRGHGFWCAVCSWIWLQNGQIL